MKHWLLASIAMVPVVAFAQSPVDLGILKCDASDIKNRIIATNIELDCTFERRAGGSEKYEGKIKRVGVDLSVKKEFKVVWTVALAGDTTVPDTLSGTYVGAAADVAAGVGGGARVLVGGGENAITLSPTSVVGIEGAGASIGLERFELKPVK